MLLDLARRKLRGSAIHVAERRLNYRRMRASLRAIRQPSRRLCSQTRITIQPSLRNSRLIRRSRFALPVIFVAQNVRLLFGILRLHIGQACQKQPSTKIATFFSPNTKSGRTIRGDTCLCRRHPRMPCCLRIPRNFTSVLSFPRLRTLDICTERVALVN